MTEVPCNGCTKCCVNDLIMLHPESGDDRNAYQCSPAINPVTGKPGWALDKKPGTTVCVYLGETGCTIHGRAPVICQEFDCGQFYAMHNRQRRQAMIAKGMVSKAVMTEGRRVTLLRQQDAQDRA